MVLKQGVPILQWTGLIVFCLLRNYLLYCLKILVNTTEGALQAQHLA
jgi:hypothetical protein